MIRRYLVSVLTLLSLFCSPSGSLSPVASGVKRPAAQDDDRKVLPPETGAYHGAFPEFGDFEDKVSGPAIKRFEQAVGKNLAWAYFSNNWFRQKDENECPRPEIKVPQAAVKTIWNHRRDSRVVPFIRMMPRSRMPETAEETHALDPIYTLQRIINGEFDAQLAEWARAARRTGIPLMVEFGTEVNGDWFPWNGRYNGGGVTGRYGDPAMADGPERFRDAYRHIVSLFRREGVRNVTWI